MRVLMSMAAAILAFPAAAALAQSAASLSTQVRQQYVSVSEPVVALTNVVTSPVLPRRTTDDELKPRPVTVIVRTPCTIPARDAGQP